MKFLLLVVAIVTVLFFSVFNTGCVVHSADINRQCVKHQAGLVGCHHEPRNIKEKKKATEEKNLPVIKTDKEMEKVIASMVPHCPMHFGFPFAENNAELTPEENYRQAAGVIEFVLHVESEPAAMRTIRRMEYTCMFLAEQKYGHKKAYWPLKIFREVLIPIRN